MTGTIGILVAAEAGVPPARESLEAKNGAPNLAGAAEDASLRI